METFLLMFYLVLLIIDYILVTQITLTDESKNIIQGKQNLLKVIDLLNLSIMKHTLREKMQFQENDILKVGLVEILLEKRY